MSDEKPMGQVIQIDEARIRDHLGEMVRALTRSSRRVVRIEYDRGESAYVAKDTETGHVVIRHSDRTRLRVMCEQFHWKMVEGEPPNVQTE